MRIQTTLSAANNQLLIPINDLPTLQTNVRMELGLDNERWDNDILFAWTEGKNELTGRHCVKPFVQVLLSHDATEAVASHWDFLPYVMAIGSTGRGMDWVVALHMNAFARPQEFAFIESRKLLSIDQASPHFRNFIEQRICVVFEPDLPVGSVVSVPADGPATPAQLGKKYTVSQVQELCEHGMIYRAEVPNALAKDEAAFDPDVKMVAGVGRVDFAPTTDRLINGVPNTLADIDVAEEAIQTLVAEDWHVDFDQRMGTVRHIRSSGAVNAGHLLLDNPRVAKVVAALEQAHKTWRKGILDKALPAGYSTSISLATVKMTLVTPVGSELKAEAAVFKSTIDRMRRRADNENSWQFKETSQGVTRWYFIPRNSGSFASLLPLDLAALCQALSIVVVTDINGVLLTAANKDGEEISTSSGLGEMLKSAWKPVSELTAMDMHYGIGSGFAENS